VSNSSWAEEEGGRSHRERQAERIRELEQEVTELRRKLNDAEWEIWDEKGSVSTKFEPPYPEEWEEQEKSSEGRAG